MFSPLQTGSSALRIVPSPTLPYGQRVPVVGRMKIILFFEYLLC